MKVTVNFVDEGDERVFILPADEGGIYVEACLGEHGPEMLAEILTTIGTTIRTKIKENTND